MSKLPELFHYTVGPKLPLILRTGALIPTGFGLALSKKERPVLWWSSHAHWEPTATKILSLDGGKAFTRPTLAALARTVGAYRFRLTRSHSSAKIVPWPQIARVAHIDAREVAGMVKHGLELGARPRDWFGVLEPVPLVLEGQPDLTLEMLSDETWAEISLTEAARHWAREGLRFHQTSISQTPAARGL